jgi:hypothetical protein
MERSTGIFYRKAAPGAVMDREWDLVLLKSRDRRATRNAMSGKTPAPEDFRRKISGAP